ncbi:hypothetical protein SAMN03159338_3829 [Sphingomonas sp. NFR04]|uniref:hypothetical protein n=1 Tax=Sphingomonas sp. NFR04 TaxID=1566283 RepID=UPI0008E1FCAD|nr:hypothetical protein [Sphingomonas sp. NFR04]SFK28287.1 hypothetical protein SAMN03159338_3829 [Sphingomonas sp. NFR04]
MREPQLKSVADSRRLMLTGLSERGPLLLLLHSSARMKLLGNRIAEFDPLAPEVFSRIVCAAQRLIDAEGSHPSELIITALDLD